jgi:chemotaxis protein CheD
MSQVVVGMAELCVVDDPAAVLVTYALGSCVAVLVHDPIRHVGGMIHYMLPNSSVAPEKAIKLPGMFADTGVPLLFERMYAHACRKQDLIVKVAGGSKLYEDHGAFEIGRRNHAMLRKMFWRVGVPVAAEDVGGSTARTARLFVATGRATVRKNGQEVEL